MNDFNFIQIARAQEETETTEAVEPHGEAEGGGLKIIPSTVAFQMLNFILLLFVLNKILYKPLITLLKNREQKIREGVENAQKAEEMVKESQTIKNEMIKTAKAESQNIVEKGRISGEQVKNGIIEEAHKEADKIVKSGQSLVDLERTKAIDDFRSYAVDLVVKASEEIIKAKLDKEKDSEIIQKSIKSLAL